MSSASQVSGAPTAQYTPAITAVSSASRTFPARQRRGTYQPGLKGQETGHPKRGRAEGPRYVQPKVRMYRSFRPEGVWERLYPALRAGLVCCRAFGALERENIGAMVCRPYGTCDLRDAEDPTTEVVGYCLSSLRDLEHFAFLSAEGANLRPSPRHIGPPGWAGMLSRLRRTGRQHGLLFHHVGESTKAPAPDGPSV